MRNRDNTTEQTQRDIEAHWEAARRKKYSPEQFDLIERAWAAGFFDGEGSVSGKQGRGVTCQLEQTITGEKRSIERDVSESIKGQLLLERFQHAVGGVGGISHRSRERGEEQPTCLWTATSQADVWIVFERIGNFLGAEKRRQFALALSIPVQTRFEHDRPLPEEYSSAEVKFADDSSSS